MGRGSAALRFATLASIALASSALAGGKSSWTNPDGVEITHYPKPGTRMLRISFGVQRGLSDAELDRTVREVLATIAGVAKSNDSEVFAVTNMFCVRTIRRVGIFGGSPVAGESCALEGAWLKADETIETRPKDNRPVYFSTPAALKQSIPSGWVSQLDLQDGLTGRVKIVPRGAGPANRVLGQAN